MALESRPPFRPVADEGDALRRLTDLLADAEALAAGLGMDFAALRIEEVAMMVRERAQERRHADDWHGIPLFQ